LGKEGHQDRRSGGLKSYRQHLTAEAKALLTRLNQIEPFALTMPMVRAANIPDQAQKGINTLLVDGTKSYGKR